MKLKPWFVTAAGCLGVTAVLASVKYLQIAEAMAFMESFPPPSETITITEARADTWAPTRLLNGTVRSPEHLVVSAETAGRIVELPYASGAEVPAGKAVLVLFNDDVVAQRDALEADLKLVQTQLKRNQTLEADALISEDQMDALRARNLSLTAQIAVLNARLSRMTVTTPFAGRLGVYSQRLGDLMDRGEVLTTLIGLDPSRWIDFKVPQGLAELSVDDTVEIRTIAGQIVGPANIIAVSEAYAPNTRTYDVRALMQAPALKHGALVQVAVPTGPVENLVSVPARSVRWDPDGAHTYVVEDSEPGAFLPHRAALRRVEVRGERGDRFYVRGELSPGDTVADKGAFKLKDHSLVAIQPGDSRG